MTQYILSLGCKLDAFVLREQESLFLRIANVAEEFDSNRGNQAALFNSNEVTQPDKGGTSNKCRHFRQLKSRKRGERTTRR